MSGLVTCDASTFVAALTDDGADGEWARDQTEDARVIAPAHMPVEAANVLRRLEATRTLNATQAAQAHADLLARRLDLWSHALLGRRAWELRHNLTIYDACYVAVAEVTGTELLTLDRRISAAPGIHCLIRTPPA